MKAIELLKERLEGSLPGARISIDQPSDSNTGVWWLDVSMLGCHVIVEWQASRNVFGVSIGTADAGLGQVADEWLPTVEDVSRRIAELLRDSSATRRRHAIG